MLMISIRNIMSQTLREAPAAALGLMLSKPVPNTPGRLAGANPWT
jgi:hypothetical protein